MNTVVDVANNGLKGNVEIYYVYQPGWCGQVSVPANLVPAAKTLHPGTAVGACNAHGYQVPMGSKTITANGHSYNIALWEHMCASEEFCVAKKDTLLTKTMQYMLL